MDMLKKLAANKFLSPLKSSKKAEKNTKNNERLKKEKGVNGDSLKSTESSLGSSNSASSSAEPPVENETVKLMREADIFLEAYEKEIATQFSNDPEAWLKSKVDAGFFPPKK